MPSRLDPTTSVGFLDISVPVSPDMLIYPGDPAVVMDTVLDLTRGDPVNLTEIHLGSHTGTHFDAPHHMLGNGVTVEHIPLEACYGPCRVIEIPPEVQAIDATLLATYDLQPTERLLLKTRNSRLWQTSPQRFYPDYAALTEDGAQYLGTLGVPLVGIDYLSVELYGATGFPAHKALFAHHVAILETLDLSRVSPGRYTLAAFPVYYAGCDGAPTRAVLLP